MIIIASAVIGALWGTFLAKKRNGTRADIAQYAVGTAIAFALVGLIVTVVLHRLILG
ncbi:MAG: apolipoprotein acyltransferase [Paracoccaceae bacterium]